jgi:hypothetical protein
MRHLGRDLAQSGVILVVLERQLGVGRTLITQQPLPAQQREIEPLEMAAGPDRQNVPGMGHDLELRVAATEQRRAPP